MKHFFLILILIIGLTGKANSQLSISSGLNSNPSKLLKDYFIGSNIVISNIQIIGKNSTKASYGYFEASNSELGINKGIILSTGNIFTASGANSCKDEVSDINNLFYDKDLSDLNGIAYQFGKDATSIEFDFVPQFNSVSFRYVFASEEYSKFVCTQYNDVFGFFISGPNIGGKANIAKVPQSNANVSINTINNGNRDCNGKQNNNCSPSNSMYYKDNITGTSLNFNGLTTILTANYNNLIIGETYRIKLAIQDVGDNLYNSAVFLEAGSFSSKINLSVACPLRACIGEDFEIKALGDPSLIYQWYTPNGQYYQSQNVLIKNCTENMQGWYKVKATNQDGISVSDSCYVVLQAKPDIKIVGNPNVCDGYTLQLEAKGANSYKWYRGFIKAGNEISNSNFLDIDNPKNEMIYVIGTSNQCSKTDSIPVFVNLNPKIKKANWKNRVCSNTTEIYQVNPENNISYTWQVSGGIIDSIQNDGKIYNQNKNAENTNFIRVKWSKVQAGQIQVVANNIQTACSSNEKLNVDIYNLEAPKFMSNSVVIKDTLSICNENSANIECKSQASKYEWFERSQGLLASPLSKNSNLIINKEGMYFCKVYNELSCYLLDSIYVQIVPKPIVDAGNDTTVCFGDKIRLNASGAMNYMWYDQNNNLISKAKTIEFPAKNNTRYYLYGENKIGCEAWDTILISVGNLPKITFDKKIQVCKNNNVKIGVNGAKHNKWFSKKSLILQESDSLEIVADSSKYMYFESTNDNICKLIDSIYIDVKNIPEIYLPNDTTICYGEKIRFTAKEGIEYKWFDKSTNQLISNNEIFDQNLYESKTFSFWAINDENCIFQKDFNVIVEPELKLQLNNAKVLCINDSILFKSFGNYTTKWYDSTKVILSKGDEFLINLNHGNKYFLSIENKTGCIYFDSIFVSNYPKLITTKDTTVCFGQDLNLNLQGASKYIWKDEFGNVLSDKNFYNFNPQKNTKLLIQAISEFGCTVDSIINIKVLDELKTDAGKDLIVCFDENINLDAKGAENYLWLDSNKKVLSKTAKYNTKAQQNTKLYLIGSNRLNCSLVDSIEIKVKTLSATLQAPVLEFDALQKNVKIPIKLFEQENLSDCLQDSNKISLKVLYSMFNPSKIEFDGIDYKIEKQIITDEFDDKYWLVSTNLSSNYKNVNGQINLNLIGDVLLADRDTSFISVVSFDNTIPINTKKINGKMILSKLCREGGTRLLEYGNPIVATTISPNPAQNAVKISLNEINDCAYKSIQIIDKLGKILKTINWKSDCDNNSEIRTFDVDLFDFASGSYSILIRSNNIVIANSNLMISK